MNTKIDSVEKIIRDWDPIELFPYAPADEYDVEILAIIEVLNTFDEIDTLMLAEKINTIFEEAFGNDVYYADINITKSIAEKILCQN